MTEGTTSAYDSTAQIPRNVSSPARASPRARRSPTGSRTFTRAPLARDDLEVGAPVPRAALVAVVAGHRLVGAVPHHLELVPVEALRHQEPRHRVGPRAGEPHVRVATAHVVRVARDAH